MTKNRIDRPFDNTDESNSGLAIISHDVRSALAGILGGIELIDTENLDAETAAQMLRIRGSSQMLKEMLNLLFEIGEDEDASPINISEELKVLNDIWSVQAKSKGYRFIVKSPSDLPLLTSNDRVSFHRILNNLINNSTKYADDTDIELSIDSDIAKQIRFEVRDRGAGFSDEALEKLFEFGGRPKNASRSGTGLGLYIAKSLVESMGGKIYAQNHPNGGASVSFTLPASLETVHADAPRKSSDLPDLSGLKILLAEDNVTNQLVVTQMLKNMGARYTVASDGVEALEAFEAEDFDLVLLDIEMPRKSGLEVLREIRDRSDPKAKAIIVALTAYVMKEHKERILNAGADGIIAKPIEGIASLGKNILGFLGNQHHEAAEPVLDTEFGEIGELDEEIFENLKSIMGPDSIAELLEKVQIDLKTIQHDLIQGETENDPLVIRSSSHTLISVAGAIGATNLQKCAQALNMTAKTDDLVQRQSLNLRCIDGIHSVLNYVESN